MSSCMYNLSIGLSTSYLTPDFNTGLLAFLLNSIEDLNITVGESAETYPVTPVKDVV